MSRINKLAVAAGFFFSTLFGSVVLTSCGGLNAAIETPPPQIRFISELQYRNSIADIFSDNIEVVGRFEALPEIEHLAAVGSSEMSISSRSYERYYSLAMIVAEQAVTEEAWPNIMPCDRPDGSAIDEECVRAGLQSLGQRTLRRDIEAYELDCWVAKVKESAGALNSGVDAVGLMIEGLLASPVFLFVVDTIEPVKGGEDVRLTGLAKAHRLSYFLWNSVPDAELLDAAQDGSLHDAKQLKAQIKRM